MFESKKGILIESWFHRRKRKLNKIKVRSVDLTTKQQHAHQFTKHFQLIKVYICGYGPFGPLHFYY